MRTQRRTKAVGYVIESSIGRQAGCWREVHMLAVFDSRRPTGCIVHMSPRVLNVANCVTATLALCLQRLFHLLVVRDGLARYSGRMRPFAWHVSVPVLLVASLAASGVALAGKPTKVEVTTLLRKSFPKDRVRVSEVLDELGAGRFPVLFITFSASCQEQTEEGCERPTAPYLAIVAGAEKTLKVEAPLALPTAQGPRSGFAWGINPIKDFDADGKPELLLVYSYKGAVEPGLGSTEYRELTLINLDQPPTVALHVLIRQEPEADTQGWDYKYRFTNGTDGAPSLLVEGDWRGDPAPKTLEQPKRHDRRSYHYDAKKAQWLAESAPQPTKSAPPARLPR